MLDKMLLIAASTAITDSDSPGEETSYEVFFENIAKLEGCSDNSRLTHLTVDAIGAGFDYDEINGLGYTDSDGKTKLTVRVHGKSFFDGRELVRLMKKCSSPVYLGDAGDEYFIYDSTYTSTCTVVSPNHAILGSDLYHAKLTADIDETFNGETLKAGLAIRTTSGIKRELAATKVTGGETVFSAVVAANYAYDSIIHAPVSKTPRLKVRYDSVILAEDISEYEDYDGYSVDFEIGSPLLALGDEYDSIDLIEGRITRMIRSEPIDESTEIEMVYYCGYRCFKLQAPGNGSSYCNVGGIVECMVEDFEMFGEGVAVSDDLETLYLYLGEDMTAENAKAWLNGKWIAYILAEPKIENISERLKGVLGAGTRYVEICSPLTLSSSLTYTRTE